MIWTRFFGRQYLGAVRSVAMPFALAISASAPLAVAWYHDGVVSYSGALLVVSNADRQCRDADVVLTGTALRSRRIGYLMMSWRL